MSTPVNRLLQKAVYQRLVSTSLKRKTGRKNDEA